MNNKLKHIGLPKIKVANQNLMDTFKVGLRDEKLKKLGLRKDAVMIINLKQKYKMIDKYYNTNKTKVKANFPVYILKDKRNLFEIEIEEYLECHEVFELSFKDLECILYENLSLLPNLFRVTIQFSNVNFNQLDFIVNLKQQNKYFSNLQELNLSFNNLTSEVLTFLREIPYLKALDLKGNYLDNLIPDISSLTNLEFLDLSYNIIESRYINLDNINDENLTNKILNAKIKYNSIDELDLNNQLNNNFQCNIIFN